MWFVVNNAHVINDLENKTTNIVNIILDLTPKMMAKKIKGFNFASDFVRQYKKPKVITWISYLNVKLWKITELVHIV